MTVSKTTKWAIAGSVTVVVLGVLVLAVVLVLKRKKCDPECGEHGTCTDGACVCTSGWEGAACDVKETPEPVDPTKVKDTRVKAVRVMGAPNACLHMAEVEVITKSGENVASKGEAIQSSTYENNPASNAVDGNPSTFQHTKCDSAQSYWQLNFSPPVDDVAKVIVRNRRDCCMERLGGAELFVYYPDSVLAKKQKLTKEAVQEVLL